MTASRFVNTDPDDPEAPRVLASYHGKHHGLIRPGDTVEYANPAMPGLGSPADDGVPLVVDELVDYRLGSVQAILNDGLYEVSADNLRKVTPR